MTNHFLFSILAIVSASLCLACCTTATDSWKNITKKKPIDNELEQIRIIARQSYWTIWYPGADGIFGQFDKKLADSSNRIGLIENDPNAKDDVVMIGPEFYLLENQTYKFTLSSWDVLHTAYLPHFRISMNAVPGMETYFTLETAASDTLQVPMLICNKVCGVNHYKMKMKIRIVPTSKYHHLMKRHK